MAKSMRSRLEREEEKWLAPYALRSKESARKFPIEDDGRAFDYRSQFQRDRDRIVYSRAFRRLRQKAQAGILPAYDDHRRNRLTHTLEVAQLARTMGRALRLNEDLIEAIALGHDLGQPAFGPAGEEALDDLLSGRLDGRGGPGLGDLGGFGRSWQSLRVVDEIEKRYEHPGLNLTNFVREGILKSGAGRVPAEAPAGVRPGLPPLFEAQTVLLADRIAGALHDLDDALQAAAVELVQVERLQAVQQLKRKLGKSYRSRASRFMKINVIHRGMVHMLVTSAVMASGRRLRNWLERCNVRDADGFRALRDREVEGTEIGLPSSGQRILEEIEGFLEARVRRTEAAARTDGRGRRVILGLFAAYHADPMLLPDHLLLRFKQLAGAPFLRDLPAVRAEREVATRYRGDRRFVRLVADHLAAMTDAYALVEHARLLEMGAVPIPSVEQLRREED
jgi:dGTPase